ncbi:MAG: nucleotidyltransferase family protein [Erythrobacter sp.]
MAALPTEVLLTLLAGRGGLSPADLAAVGQAGWEALDARAAEHRCQPILHRTWGCVPAGEAIPAAIRARWAAAFRASAITALAQRADLHLIVDRFDAAGIACIALKGSWLAWTCYAEPAQRVLRDLDVLVRPDRALEGRALLLRDGWSEGDSDGLAAADWLARFKHLPPLHSPSGTVLELHTRLWDQDGRNPPEPAGLFGRSQLSTGTRALRYLDRIDNVMHLAVHAAFHRFDGGPLMLLDCERITACLGGIDHAALWRRAGEEGWARHAALFIAATDRWVSPGIAQRWDCPIAVPAELVEELPFLLAKPLAAREADIAAAKMARPDLSPLEKARRVLARRERHDGLCDYLGWIGQEVVGIASGRSEPGRRQAIAALDRWLAS